MAEAIFTPAAEVHEVATEVLQEEEFQAIVGETFLYYFRSQHQKKSGKQVYGTAEVVRGKNAVLYKRDGSDFFRIVIAEDLWEELDDNQRKFLVRHELRHCILKFSKATKSMRKAIKPHDFELFLADLKDPCMESVCTVWNAVKAAQNQTRMELE